MSCELSDGVVCCCDDGVGEVDGGVEVRSWFGGLGLYVLKRCLGICLYLKG